MNNKDIYITLDDSDCEDIKIIVEVPTDFFTKPTEEHPTLETYTKATAVYPAVK